MTNLKTNDWTPVSPRTLNLHAYLAEQSVVFKPQVIQHLLDQCASDTAVEQALAMPSVRGGLRHMQHLRLPGCGMHPSDLEILHINTTSLRALHIVDEPGRVKALRGIGAFTYIKQLTIVSDDVLSAEAADLVLSYEHLQHLDLQCEPTREQLLRFMEPDRSLHVKLSRYHGLLWSAVVQRDQPLLRALQAVGADINSCDEHKMTLMTLAVAHDKLEAVPALIGAGADVHVSDACGFTPIAWASLRGNESALRLLVGMGADIHRLDPHGRTPLDLAIRANALGAVRYLVASGADVRALSGRGSTPLIEAALYGDLDMVRFLVGAGAHASIACKRGLKPAAHAQLAGRHDIAAFLKTCV